MTSLKTDCRKFAPNIFNKTKCQNCFRGKDVHSAEALESNRATRKMCLCSYLFVAPDWDFSLPANRNKRWQRRWFVLYDDGELAYSVDECPETVPQAVIDMNCVLEVADAENVTGNQFALAITLPEKVHFIKGTSKEETKKWFEVLSRFPRNTVCGKYKRNATFPGVKALTIPNENNFNEWVNRRETVQVTDYSKHNKYASSLSKNIKDRSTIGSLDPESDVFPTKDTCCSPKYKDHLLENKKEKDVGHKQSVVINSRNTKTDTSILNNVPLLKSKEHDTSNQDDDRKRNEDISETSNEKNFREIMKDKLDARAENIRRYLKQETKEKKRLHSRSDVTCMIPSLVDENNDKPDWKKISCDNDSSECNSKNYHHNPVYLLMSDVPSGKKIDSYENFFKVEKPQHLKRQSSFGKKSDIIKQMPAWSENQKDSEMKGRTIHKSASVPNAVISDTDSSMPNGSLHGSSYFSENDDKGQLRSKLLAQRYEKSVSDNASLVRGDPDGCNLDSLPPSCCTSAAEFITDHNSETLSLKKGWLVKQENSKWNKHWFVLRNSALTYYSDPITEDAGILDGVVDLRKVQSVSEVQSNSGHTFCVLMKDDSKLFLSAVTSKIRNTWIRAIFQAAHLKENINADFVKNKHDSHTKPDTSKDGLTLSSDGHSVISSADSERKDIKSNNSKQISVVEEEEENRTQMHHSSIPLPPSPPLARTAISRVKERARTRSHSRGRISRFNSAELHEADHSYLADSDDGTTDHSSSSLPTTTTVVPSKDKKSAKVINTKYSEDTNKPERQRSLKLSCSDVLNFQDGRKKVMGIKDKLEDSSWTIWLDISKFCKEVEAKLDDIEKSSSKGALQQPDSKNTTFCYLSTEQKKEIGNLVFSLDKMEEKLQKVQNELQKAKVNLLLANKENDFGSTVSKSIGCHSPKQEVTKLNGGASQNVLLAQQLNKLKEQNRRLKVELKAAQTSTDTFELDCIALKQDNKHSEALHQSQMSLMVARVEDLTTKLLNSEKNVRQLRQRVVKLEQRQERRRSSLKGKDSLTLSKEYESKLSELEQKIDAVEVALKGPEETTDANDLDEKETSGKETQSLLMRLHNLDKKVKDVSEVVEDQCTEDTIVQEDFTKPIIRLQVKIDENIQNQDLCEDWNSLSLSTSMTDLTKSEKEEQDQNLGLSFQNCLENLNQQMNSLVSWLRTALQLIYAQSNLNAVHSTKPDILNFEAGKELDTLIQALDHVTGKIDETAIVPQCLNDTVEKLLYRIILLQEITSVLFKMSSFEKYKAAILMQHLMRIKQAVLGIEQYIMQKSSSVSVNAPKISLCSIVSQLFFYHHCSTSILSSCNQNEVEQLCEEVESYRKRISVTLNEFKIKFIENFCTTILELSEKVIIDEPVMANAIEQKTELRPFGQKQFLSHISHIITQVSQSFITHVSKSLNELYLLSSSVQYSEKWTAYICKLLQQQLNLLSLEIQNICVKHLDSEFFSSSKCGVLVEYMHCSICELAQLVSIDTVVEGTIVLIKDEIYCYRDENQNKDCLLEGYKFSVSQEVLNTFYESLQYRTMSIMTNLPIHRFPNAFWSLCNLNEINVAHRSVSSLLCFKQKWKTLVENERKVHKTQLDEVTRKLNELCKEQKRRADEGCKSCIELGQEVSYLQAELDESRALVHSESICEKCASLKLEIQKLMEQHERDTFVIQRLEDQDGRWKKHVQDIIKEKEKLFNEEKWKLEKELQSAKKLLQSIESQYDDDLQNLQTLYEQKLSQKQHDIKEEVLRCRYSSEIGQLKALCEKGLETMEGCHKKIVTELEQRHQNELEDLMVEREKILAEEARATAVALEAVRKAHKEELQRQVQKFKEEFVQKMSLRFETEAYKKGYESEMSNVKNEILSITDKYSVKCLENAALQENVELMTEQLKSSNCQVIELRAKNKRLQARLVSESMQKQEELL